MTMTTNDLELNLEKTFALHPSMLQEVFKIVWLHGYYLNADIVPKVAKLTGLRLHPDHMRDIYFSERLNTMFSEVKQLKQFPTPLK